MNISFKYFILVFLSVFSSNYASAETAEQILSRCAGRLENSPSVTLKFNLSYSGATSNCELIIDRDKYRLSSSDMEVWYDGSTQWSYVTADRELSITDPTSEELMESNPFAILNNFKKLYTFRQLSGNNYDIELISKNKMSNIRKAVITIDSKTYMPKKLIATMANGRTFSATITSAIIGKKLPISVFTYDKNNFPAKTTIDLR